MMATVSTRNDHLLGGGSQVIELSLLTARASAASRRVASGLALDEHDLAATAALSSLLVAAAQSAEYFGSAGQHGSPAVGALAPQVDAAIDAVLDEPLRGDGGKDLSERLQELADVVSQLPTLTSEAATVIADFLAEMAASVLRQTGRVGEVTTAL